MVIARSYRGVTNKNKYTFAAAFAVVAAAADATATTGGGITMWGVAEVLHLGDIKW